MRGIHRSQRPVTRSFGVSLICARINGWANNREAGDLRRRCAHYDVTVMQSSKWALWRPKWLASLKSGVVFVQSSGKHQNSWLLVFWEGNPATARGFPTQMASDVESVSTFWRPHYNLTLNQRHSEDGNANPEPHTLHGYVCRLYWHRTSAI